ncbi:hypothetical protein Mpt1_c02850 [Candidatus Methanoplasma termitum]|uniref:Transcriptional regulator n=1 Tax=Candidatus Methanoplasma termitum TaxID=1577791 RepID=A0A0A7LAL0_9ARCH|nr:Zn-ribbon domain-containing OB-fold protein [Candidatus Methanoplasma termitum]AIZ56185.1 hypothetical protein Mpt1_c02850 [Candidatus Methanoplasma termitum]MCL2333542.1 Zn-ribbon domain-containing OB-fold protein [Candidatus Methanoplasma sp.]
MSSVARAWREFPGKYNLEGTKCGNCNTVFFPRRDFCPKCRREGLGKMQKYKVQREGEVFSFSVIYDAPSCNSGSKPYAVAMVRTKDGVLVSGQLVDVELDKIAIGMPVRAVLRKLEEDGVAGIIRYGFKFVPAI